MAIKFLAAEDGDLQSRSLVTSRNRIYSDLDLTFNKKPSGDVYKKTDAAAVKQAVKNLLLTNTGEKPFDPYYGGDLNNILFELAGDTSNILLQEYISEAIRNYEPRARIISIVPNVSPDSNTARVRIEFQIVDTQEVVVFETSIIRLR